MKKRTKEKSVFGTHQAKDVRKETSAVCFTRSGLKLKRGIRIGVTPAEIEVTSPDGVSALAVEKKEWNS